MTLKHINPYVFFKIIDHNLILWNYRDHEQFIIEPKYLLRLLEWSQNNPSLEYEPRVDEELTQNKILAEQPFEHPAWGWDVLSHIFHFGTRNVVGASDNPDTADQEYLAYCEGIVDKKPELFAEREGPRVVLPPPQWELLDKASLGATLRRRMTSRSFSREMIPLETLSTVLAASFGRLYAEGWPEMEALDVKYFGYRRTSSSGGALQTCDAYVLAFHIEGLEPGVYHYRSQDHQLTLVNPGQFSDQLGSLMSSQYFANDLSFGVFLVGRFERAWWKYPHSRCYRIVLLDAGHLSQTFQLVSTALGLDTWVSGAFNDDRVDAVLKLTDQKQASLFFVGAGLGDRQPVPRDMLALLRAKAQEKAKQEAEASLSSQE